MQEKSAWCHLSTVFNFPYFRRTLRQRLTDGRIIYGEGGRPTDVGRTDARTETDLSARFGLIEKSTSETAALTLLLRLTQE